jgi:hypothetical protein
MKHYIFIIIFFLFSIGLYAQSSEQAVLDLSKKKFGWMTRLSYDSLESALDDRLLFVHSNGWTETKEEFIQDIKSGKLRYVDINVTEANARMYSGTAIVTGKGNFKVLLDGNELVINLYYTEVYVWKNDKWLLASRHANRLP